VIWRRLDCLKPNRRAQTGPTVLVEPASSRTVGMGCDHHGASGRGGCSCRSPIPTAEAARTGASAGSGGELVEEVLRVALAVVSEVEFRALPPTPGCYVDESSTPAAARASTH
jgi:hypothetical protein